MVSKEDPQRRHLVEVRPLLVHTKKIDRKIASMLSVGKQSLAKTTFVSYISRWNRMTVFAFTKKFSST
jgi:hypothetical protein